jgi:hypothetical protein
LEIVYTGDRIEGSNPSLSAILHGSNLSSVILQIIKLPSEPQYS